ncbi:MAG: hydroxymethylbilane synthase [Bacteroidetes bacterium]|nr:hydroxymethylbilane synthase [Bacteroidota bacterium]
MKIKAGTRGSELALWQTNWVCGRLREVHPGIEIEIKIIKTQGDRILDVSLSKIGDKGLFTKAIEDALLGGEIDFAVHSLKDLPTSLPEGLCLAAVPERETRHDAFVSNTYNSLKELPAGAKVATGSLRRKCQLLNMNPGLEIIDIRGNVNTRLKKFEENGYDGLILAYAGLKRLGLERYVKEIINEEIMLPAVSQGALGIEARTDDKETAAILAPLNSDETRKCVEAERAFLHALEGGCQIPIGVYTSVDGGRLNIKGMAGSIDGRDVARAELDADLNEPEKAGRELGAIILEKGGKIILDKIRNGG